MKQVYENWWAEVAYLVDILDQLNKVNMKQQGKNIKITADCVLLSIKIGQYYRLA